MIAKELISNEVSALRTSDTGEETITMMSIFHVKHLPIVNDTQFLGLISEEDVLSNNMEEPIGSYALSLAKPFCKDTDHIFEAMSKMARHKLTVIPVIDQDENYLGLITQDDLIQFYAQTFSFAEPGSIVVISTPRPNYSLAELSRIIEAENAQILSTMLSEEEGTNNVLVTLKLNRNEIQNILASLERFDYEIKASFAEIEYVDGLKDRYDLLMNYLNV